jgi:PAP2 superfamily
VIVPFTMRWKKRLFWPIVVLDGVMFASAVPSGNHYLADLFGGVAVADWPSFVLDPSVPLLIGYSQVGGFVRASVAPCSCERCVMRGPRSSA